MLPTTRRPPRWLALTLVLALLSLPFAGPAHATLTGQVGINMDLRDTRTVGTETATSTIAQAFTWTISHGTGANQAQQCYQGVRTLTTGATEDLDLQGALTNLFGTTLFSALKFIAVSAAAANTTNITISRPAGATGVTLFGAVSGSLAPLKPGGFFAFADPSAAGVPVTASTADLITITNSAGASATYTVVICGEQ
jgi:hypothetical protein